MPHADPGHSLSFADRFRRDVLSWLLWLPVVAVIVWIGTTWMPGTYDNAILQGKAPKAADFQHFFYAAEHVWQGKSPYTSFGGGYVYPPLLATVLAPLAPLGIERAAQVWFVIDMLLVVAIVWVAFVELSKRFAVPRDRLSISTVVVMTTVLGLEVIRRELSDTQTDTLVLLGFLGGLVFMDKPNTFGPKWTNRLGGLGPILGGLSLAFSLHIKFLAIVFIPYLLITRRWKTAAWMLVWTVLIGLSTAPLYGWDTNLDYLARSSGGVGHLMGFEPPIEKQPNVHHMLWNNSIGIPSGIARILEGRITGEQDKKADSFGTVYAIVSVIAVFCCITAWWMYKRNAFDLIKRLFPGTPRDPNEGAWPVIVALEWAAVIAVIISLGPQTMKRHTFIGLPLLMMGVMMVFSPRRSVKLGWMIFGLVLVQLAQYLPPRGIGKETPDGRDLYVDIWKGIGGLGWAWLIFYFTLLWTGLRHGAAIARGEPTAWKSPGVNEPLSDSLPADSHPRLR